MKNEIRQYGFIPSTITSEHYILGAFNQLPKVIIQPDRNWKPFLPQWESQIGKFETFACTVFGTLNAIETYLRKLNTDRNYDYSERFNYILANITPPGADPHFVSEILRKFGVIEQAELPFTNTLEEFMLPKPMTEDKLNKGKEWGYVFQHEWLFTSYPGKDNMVNQIREALQYSPVCLSVTAWYEENGLYVDNGQPNGHWTLCYGIDDDGGLLIFDSYALVQNGVITNAFKKLHPDHKVLCAKRYFITKKLPVQEQLNIIEKILIWIQEQIELLKKKPMYKPLSEIIEPTPVIVQPEAVLTQPEASKSDRLSLFCQYLTDFEGKPGDLNYRNKNPGNIRGRDGKFLVFKTWDIGMEYLKDYVLKAITGKHLAYKKYYPSMNFYQFFRVYAPTSDNNQPSHYAEVVCKRMQVSPNDIMKTTLNI